jgi:hypothetical protein
MKGFDFLSSYGDSQKCNGKFEDMSNRSIYMSCL